MNSIFNFQIASVFYNIVSFFIVPAVLLLSASLRRTIDRSVRYSAAASPSFSLSKREGAALHLFNDHHNYHISIISLLITFGESD
jgi:hypothetical protein